MMFKRVRARRDILMSPSFRQGQSLRAEWTAWIEALQGPDDQLVQFLCGKQIGIPV